MGLILAQLYLRMEILSLIIKRTISLSLSNSKLSNPIPQRQKFTLNESTGKSKDTENKPAILRT